MRAPRDYATDEMFDSEEDLGAPGRLGEFLRKCAGCLLRPYDEADRRALNYQARYRRLATCTAWCVALTLLADAAYLAAKDSTTSGEVKHVVQRVVQNETILTWIKPKVLARVESCLALVSLLLVALGLWLKWQKNWLLLRYKAERYRLLKFQLLTEPSLWGCGPDTEWESKLDKKAQAISRLKHHDLDKEAATEDVAKSPSADMCRVADPDDVSRLLDYYKRRRLQLQLDYFKSAPAKLGRPWLLRPWLAPVVFLGAMVLLAVHALLDRDLLFIAAIFAPAMLAALRLRVTANETSRNYSRSRARKHALEQIAERLDHLDVVSRPRMADAVPVRGQARGGRVLGKIEGPAEVALVLSQVALAEQILSTDQHEWLRLMLEAEWYR